jgi:hypothetical protein
MALLNQVEAQRLDERAFTHAGHTADAEAQRIASMWQQSGQQIVALGAVIRTRGFQQSDRLGNRATLVFT